MAVVTLVSGGIDSLVMCKMLKNEEEKQYPIFIDYGQLANEKEWISCKKVFKKSNLPEPERIDLSGYGKAIKSGITDERRDIYTDAFLPGRNLMFLVIASAYAYQNGIKNIAIGLLSERNHLFSDQTEEFLVNANFAINSALGDYITILTPLINFNKGEVIELAKRYKLPIDETYSCHSGKEVYCGKCIACKEIIAAIGKQSLPQFKHRGD